MKQNSEILHRVKKRILIAQMFNSRDRFDVNTRCSPKTHSCSRQSCQLKHAHVFTKVHGNNGSMAIVALPTRLECWGEIKCENKIHMTGHRNFLCACLCVADITCGTKMAFPCWHFFYFCCSFLSKQSGPCIAMMSLQIWSVAGLMS